MIFSLLEMLLRGASYAARDERRAASGDFYQSRAWKELRYRALLQCGSRCQCCGASASTGAVLHVDHIKPRSKYPHLQLSLSNLQVLCERCNLGKGAWDSTDWRTFTVRREERIPWSWPRRKRNPTKDRQESYSKARADLQSLAEKGNAFAQTRLGLMYAKGQDIPQDYAKAMQWFRLAAQQGNGLAQANLGVMYYNGQGVSQDYVKAYMWSEVATANGFKEADANMPALAARMTSAQIVQARQEAAEWWAARRKSNR